MKIQELINKIESQKNRSKWSQGVAVYSLMMLEELQEETDEISKNIKYSELEKILLKGAENWRRYSWGGGALIYDYQIAEQLATPSELKRTRHGERRPNSYEEWLDTQARALIQAFERIYNTLKEN